MKHAALIFIALLLLFPLPAVSQQSEQELLEEADSLFNDGNFTQARLKYREHQLQYPESGAADRVAFRLAEATSLDRSLPRDERFAEAIRLYELAITLHETSPLAPEALVDLAESYLNLGFIQDAIIQLRRARENYPEAENAEEMLLLLADSFYFLDDFRQSSIYYQSYLNEYPQSTHRKTVLAKQAESLHLTGNFQQAQQHFDSLIEEFPGYMEGNADLYFLMAENLHELGRLGEAEEAYQLLAEGDHEYLKPFVYFGQAAIYEKRAESAEDAQKNALLERAMRTYFKVYREYGESSLEVASLLETVRLADELDLKFSSEFNLPRASDVLLNLYDRSLDPNAKALILIRLAQHHRTWERYVLALDYYKQAVELYSDTEISGQTLTEYNKFLREMMNNAWEVDDFDQYLNLFLTYGLRLDLDLDERFRVAICYMRVGLFDEAEEIFSELLAFGLDEARTRRIAFERMRYYYKRQDWDGTIQQINIVLAMEPLPRQRELAYFYQQEIAFANRDLDFLQSMYFDEPEKLDTPLLEISMLQKLARLQFLNKNFDLARQYVNIIFSKYNPPEVDEYLLRPIFEATILIRADVLYVYKEYAAAADLYQRYLFFMEPGESSAWALAQLAESLLNLNRNEFAREVMQTYLDRYQDHYLAGKVRLQLDGLTP